MTDLGAMFHISFAVQKQTDHLCSTLEAGQRQCSVAIGFDLCVDVRAHVQQQLHCRYMAIHGCQHQRRDAQLAPCPERARSNLSRNTEGKEIDIPTLTVFRVKTHEDQKLQIDHLSDLELISAPALRRILIILTYPPEAARLRGV